MSPSPVESFDHEKELAAVGVQEAREINKLNLDAAELKELDVSFSFKSSSRGRKNDLSGC